MSAIERLAEDAERIPEQDLRQVDALSPFFMVARRPRSFELFSEHPPVEERIRPPGYDRARDGQTR